MVHFHLYSQLTDFKAYEEAFNSDRVKIAVHSGTDLFGDMLHMIRADLFVISKSSLSNVVNYYRRGLTIARPFWHALTNVVYHGLDGAFASDQESLIASQTLAFHTERQHDRSRTDFYPFH